MKRRFLVKVFLRGRPNLRPKFRDPGHRGLLLGYTATLVPPGDCDCGRDNGRNYRPYAFSCYGIHLTARLPLLFALLDHPPWVCTPR